jgi:RNA polymerase sigma-54 factor
MRFETSQHMQLGQHMKLAPRMIQSMEILQMPMLALQERIDQELESNIALELVEPGSEQGADQAPAESPADADREDRLEQRELVVSGDDSSSEDWERLSALESEYREAFDNEYSSQRFQQPRSPGERDKKMDAMANVAARHESLTEQLLHQWSLAEVDPETAAIGRKLITYIDADGLLSTDLATILEQNASVPGSEQLTMESLERSLAALQEWLEPPGIAARDQRESLLLQIAALQADAEDAHDWSEVKQLIVDHFDDLLQNRLPKISQKSGMSLERIQTAMGLMRRLNLSPGRDLVDESAPPVIPDVIVEFDEQVDQYVASLTDGLLPTLRISKRYEKMARDREVEKGTREFVSNNVRNAMWLIDAINQRKHTLLRVVNAVLARQREYFDSGPQHLKPLPMTEVADQLGIHVGTVSRAVSDKWLETPRGIVPLRKFFSGGTETASGEDVSWEAVKATLKEIVDAEDKTNPLSDESLSAELKKRGIDIARRTVVKYRSQLHIPPARQRRTFVSNGDSQ